MFDEDTLQCLAVVDWELASCGGVLTDLVSCLLAHPITPMGGINAAGGPPIDDSIPKYTDLMKLYSERRGIGEISHWLFNVFTAVQIFRLCSIIQGIVKRRSQGIASGDTRASSHFSAATVKALASMGLSVAHSKAKL